MWRIIAAFDIDQGDRYFRRSEYDRAIECYSRVIHRRPNYAVAYRKRGMAFHNLKHYDEAIADYTKAIRFRPDYAKAYNYRAVAYCDLKRYGEALADCNEAIRLKEMTGYAEAHNTRGAVHHNLGHYDEAMQDFDQAISLCESNNRLEASVHLNRGQTYLALQRYDEALQNFDQAIYLAPKNSFLYRDRGKVYLAKKDYHKAIQDFDKAIQMYSNDYEARGLREKASSERSIEVQKNQHARVVILPSISPFSIPTPGKGREIPLSSLKYARRLTQPEEKKSETAPSVRTTLPQPSQQAEQARREREAAQEAERELKRLKNGCETVLRAIHGTVESRMAPEYSALQKRFSDLSSYRPLADSVSDKASYQSLYNDIKNFLKNKIEFMLTSSDEHRAVSGIWEFRSRLRRLDSASLQDILDLHNDVKAVQDREAKSEQEQAYQRAERERHQQFEEEWQREKDQREAEKERQRLETLDRAQRALNNYDSMYPEAKYSYENSYRQSLQSDVDKYQYPESDNNCRIM